MTCIVGGGLAGVSLLEVLARRGHAAVLLEKGRIGDGASGLNGGMVLPGWGAELPALVEQVGAAAADDLYRLSLEGVRLVRARVARQGIACDAVQGAIEAIWTGKPKEAAEWVATGNARFNTRLALWDAAETRVRYKTPHYRAALFDPDALHLDPLAYLRGLADLAEAAGGRIFEDSAAARVERTGTGFAVATADGARVKSGRVVLCTGADGRGLDRRLDRSLLPLLTGIVVTDPLGEGLRRAIDAPYAAIDDRFVTGYYRPLPNGRLLWGGGLAGRDRGALRRRLLRDLARVYPQLKGLGVAQAWTGRMAFTRHRMPIVRELDPGLWAAAGFGGHGLNTTAIAAELLARAIVAGDPAYRVLDPFRPVAVGGIVGHLGAHGLVWAKGLRESWRMRDDRAG